MHEQPQREHEWLEQLVGEWIVEGDAAMPDGSTAKHEGTESARSLGGMWTVCEGRMPMPDGSTGITIMTLGYDPKKSYTGTFIGSMMTHLWQYEGTLDAAGKALTLEAEGESFAGDGRTVPYRDTITIESPDHRILTSAVQDEAGTWQTFMTAHYRRTG